MSIPPGIFKSYDIRGIYPTEINEENISQIITAIYVFFQKNIKKKKFKLVLGRDMRISSPVLTDIARKTLVELGAQVIDVGLVSTPTFYFAVSHFNYDAGIQITASHNPKEYNGAKFVMNGPHGLIKIGKSTGMDEVKELALQKIATEKTSSGSVTNKENIYDEEATNALQILQNPKIKKFTIVADPANAMGSTYIEALSRQVPMNLIKMNFALDGNFPSHQPDPLQAKNLVDLQKKVTEAKADLGLAPDGDGDRLFFVDEKGNVVPPTIITSIISKELLKQKPHAKILVDIRYILTPKKIIEENNGKMDISKVGHAFITEAMNKTGAIFAGESSAHYFYQATGNAESQLPTIITILKVLTGENCTFSDLVEKTRRSYESGEINFEVSNAKEVLEKLKEKYSDGDLSELDGVSVSYKDWRFNARTSNTEPLLRLNVESYTKDQMELKKQELVQYISSFS